MERCVSNSLFTERQEYYSAIFHLNSIYTPEVIVNGETEFVGSDKSKLINSIDEQLSEKPAANIALKAIHDTGEKIEVSYSTGENNSQDANLMLLVVQKMATNKINRGENEGRILHHINIVREISYLPVTTKETTKKLSLPQGLKKEDIFIAGFIQENRSGKVKAIKTASIQ